MASDGEACCESDPNFAVICGFLEKFGVSCGLANIDFLDLQDMLENNQEVPQELIDLHVKLLRKARKSVSSERWERAIIKFCHGFCSQDAWEIERFGYKKARLSSKLRILKELLEIQFDYNSKFKNEVNKLSAQELRTQPLGRDRLGHIYWFQSDNSCQIRVYKEDLDEETWALVAKNREDLVTLITQLNDGKETVVNEDSNSLESEKPVVDTGQTDSSNSSKIDLASVDIPEETAQINGTNTSETDEEVIPPKEHAVKQEIDTNYVMLDLAVNYSKENLENTVKIEENSNKSEEVCNKAENISTETEENSKDMEDSKEKEHKTEETNEVGDDQNNVEGDREDQPEDLKTRVDNDSSSVSETKKEVVGVKEKYIRSDFISSSVSHTKAVDSAGFNVHTNYLKRPPHEEEDWEEEPSCVKRPRLDRPTLLGNKKKKSYSDDEEEEDVSDERKKQLAEIEENERTGSPIVGEEIEESVMHFVGEGSGNDCETGNEQVQASVNQPDENSTSDTHTVNEVQSVEAGNVIKVPWDSENPREQIENEVLCNSNNEVQKEGIENSEQGDQTSRKSMFFFGPGCLKVTPTISPKKKNEDEDCNKIINDKTEEIPDTSDKPRNLVLNRRKSDKPIRKISGSDIEHKELITSKEPERIEPHDVTRISSSSKENNLVQSYNVNNLLPSPNHVPKNISISDTKDDSSKNFDNKLVDVPLINKTDCSSTTKSDKGGLPKNTSTLLVDKPKSKLENVLEKINQGKIIKKTDGLGLDKHKNNNLTTIMETKVLENTPLLEKTISEKDSLNNKVFRKNSSKESSVSTDISNSLDLSKKKDFDTSQLSSKSNVKNATQPRLLGDQAAESTTIQIVKLPKEEVCLESDSKEPTDIPKLEDNTIVKLSLESDNIDLSPPPLEREVIDEENHSQKTTIDEIKQKQVKTKSGKTRIAENSESSKKTEEIFDDSRAPGKRITRRTRSNADKGLDPANDKESGDVDEVKTKSKVRKKDECPKIDKDLEALATNRELRERKTTTLITNKEKPKKLTKTKKEVEDTKAPINNKEKRNSNRFREERKTDKIKTTDLDEIEEQIVKVDNRPSKKLKLTESVQNSEEKKNTPKVEEKDNKGVDDLKPVEEPKCIKKNVALLTDGEKVESLEDATAKDSSEVDEVCVGVDEDNSSDIIIVPDSDPLACSEEDSKYSQPPMTLATFKIDVDDNDAIVPMRITRKRAAQQSVDTLRESTNFQKKSGSGKKRSKVKRKRSADLNRRRTIEAKKSKEISTSEEDNQEPTLSANENHESSSSKSPNHSSGESKADTSITQSEPKEKKPRQMRKTLLGLEISQETENILREDAPMGVRQSRRIAQLKIKEQAERRKIEELTIHDLKEEKVRKGKKDIDKDYKLEKKKKKHVPTEDESTGDGEFEEKKKRKKKKKHRDPRKQFDVHNPWKSSSGSSSSSVEEEEEEIEEDDDHPMVLKSDHEFSPESDLEEGTEIQPLKRARTAKKESDPEEEIDDYACQKCSQSDHPEWILLCDSCDSGWHCSCLRPALLVIPEGDWFCPPCQHGTLVKNLETQLIDYDKRINKKVMETRRKERLAYVGISLDNVLPAKESDEYKNKNRHIKENNDDEDEDMDSDDSDSDDSSSGSESGTTTDSDSEPIYQLRKRRQAHSYRFNDYDDLINSAIQDEMDAVKGAGNQGRGKDISTIVNAEKQETESFVTPEVTPLEVLPVADLPTDLSIKNNPVVENLEPVIEPLPPVVPVDYDRKADESDEDIIRPVRKIISKKKHRKLNSLDVSSGDDAESDEDFKGSSTSGSDEDDYAGSDSSDDLDSKRGKRYRDYAPIRRSTRARISRYDRDFINDDSDTDGGSKRKKNRSVWEESESEESDRSWGRRKRRAARPRKKPSDKPKRVKKKKKKRTGEDSDPDVYRKRPNIKFGGLNDDEETGRRTRGKKINYLEALGTDSDDDVRRKPPRIEESDDEYAVHEDEDLQQRLANENDSDESGVENVLRDLPLPLNPKPRSKGRGKAGLKIPRKPKDQPNVDLFAPLMPNLSTSSTVMSTEMPALQQTLECQSMMGHQMMSTPLLLGSSIMSEQEAQELDDEPNPIEQINKNVEQMNEQEMEKMMEEEDYANRQLQLVALQIEKEKRRKERERLEKLAQAVQVPQIEQKIPKKRGRKPKNQALTATTNVMAAFTDSSALISNNAELSEPPGVSLPMFNEIAPNLNADGSPKKRRERESPLHSSKLGIAAPPQPFSQSQPAPSVITRMLQSQPGQGNFNPSAISKYFGGTPNDPQLGTFHPGATGPRGSLPPVPFQQPSPDIPHFPVIRSGPPPLRLHSPGTPALPPMYHTHRTMDPSPSGGGPINVPISNRDRQSPAVVSPSSNSPLSKGDPTPPPYTRPPPVGHFPPVSSNNSTGAPRQIPMVTPPHLQQHRTSNISPFHPTVPPNYHYGPYPPPPLTTDEGQPAPNYPASYPEQYPEGGGPVPPPEGGVTAKSFEEGDEGGEFVGLVSYFSSQREDDLDT